MKIAVYAIAKNESQFVERFCEAAKDADLIFVADTGSTDDTVDKLLSMGATVQIIHISPWRFDDARNTALALLPDDIDVCMSLDLDEVLQPGWREEIERVWTPGTNRLRYGFDWGCGIVFQYEKCRAPWVSLVLPSSRIPRARSHHGSLCADRYAHGRTQARLIEAAHAVS
jgi:glycosyltransferase involved in cell wall biosynthesis